MAPLPRINAAKGVAAFPVLLHARLIFSAPSVGEISRVDVISERLKDTLAFAGDAVPPVDQRPEHVEKHRPNGGHGEVRGANFRPANKPVRPPKIMAKSLIKWLDRREWCQPSRPSTYNCDAL